MYGFVDTIESPTDKGLMSIQTVFNGRNLDRELSDDSGSFTTLTVSGRSNVSQRIQPIPVPGLDGEIEQNNPTIDIREPSIKFRIQDETNEGFRERLTRLIELLRGSKKEMKFTDEDAIYYATLRELDIPDEESNDLIGNLIMYCSDPYKYGPEQTENISDNDVIENNGTANADPIFELTAKEKATFAMVSLGADVDSKYNLIGTPADDDIEEVDTKTTVLYENGSTLDEWSKPPMDMIDDPNVSNIGGDLGYDDAGIRPNPYGPSGSGQRGGALYRELPDGIQDFELETSFDIISRREEENWRMMIYLHDENLNPIGQLGLKDNSRVYKRRVPLATAGPHSNDYNNGRVLGDKSKYNDKARDTTLFYLRMKREGRKFSFYVGEWRNFKHINVWEGSYIDTNDEYLNDLKYITLFIGSYQDRVIPSRIRMNSVEISRLGTVTEDQTPYIVYPGDEIVFDHKNDDVLINGEARPDLNMTGAFGGSFFKLEKGFNNVIVTPFDTFDSKVTFRDKYL